MSACTSARSLHKQNGFMCGRYLVAMADLVSMFAVGEVSDSLPGPTWNIEHTNRILVVLESANESQLVRSTDNRCSGSRRRRRR